jgi:hypothetical protein
LLKTLVEKYLGKVLKTKRMMCTEIVPTTESACVINMMKLYDSLAPKIRKGEDDG